MSGSTERHGRRGRLADIKAPNFAAVIAQSIVVASVVWLRIVGCCAEAKGAGAAKRRARERGARRRRQMNREGRDGSSNCAGSLVPHPVSSALCSPEETLWTRRRNDETRWRGELRRDPPTAGNRIQTAYTIDPSRSSVAGRSSALCSPLAAIRQRRRRDAGARADERAGGHSTLTST